MTEAQDDEAETSKTLGRGAGGGGGVRLAQKIKHSKIYDVTAELRHPRTTATRKPQRTTLDNCNAVRMTIRCLFSLEKRG